MAETWFVKNNSRKNIAIGDLMFVPSIAAGQRVDLLRFATKQQVEASTDLQYLLKSRILTLTKTPTPSNVYERKVKGIEADEMDADLTNYYTKSESYSKSETYTKAEVDALLVAAHNRLIVSVDPKSGQYGSINAAIAAVVAPAHDNRWVIKVEPGEYTEVGTCVVPTYTYVVGDHIAAVVVEQSVNNVDVFQLRTDSGISFLTIRNATAASGIVAADIGDFCLTHKVTVENCLIGVEVSSAAAESIYFTEYVDFLDCDTSISVTSAGGFTAFLNSENLWIEQDTVTPTTAAVVINGADAEVNIQGVSIVGRDLAPAPMVGTAVLITSGGYLNVSSGRIEYWNKAFSVPAGAGTPYLKVQAIDFDENTTDIEILDDNCVGYYQGSTDIDKIVFNDTAPWFVANDDRKIIEVNKHGGDFTSVKAAVEYALDQVPSDTNKFLVKIGPGIFEEDEITLASNVYIDGVHRYATEIKGKAGQYLFHASVDANPLINAPKTAISNCILNANNAAETIVKYDGGLVRFIAVRFYSCSTAVNATSVAGVPAGGYSNSLQLNDCSVGPGKTITNFIRASSNGVLPFAVLMNNTNIADGTVKYFVWAEAVNTTVRITNCRLVQSSITAGSIAIQVQDAVIVQSTGTIIEKFAKGLYIPNTGAGPQIELMGTTFVNNTSDIEILHDAASGTISAIACKELMTIDPLATIGLNILDSDDGSVIIVGDYFQGKTFDTIQNYTPIIIQGQSLGAIHGGTVDAEGSGNINSFDISIESGYGYLNEGDDPDQYAKYVEWNTQILTLPASANSYVYIDPNGIAQSSSSRPDIFKTIILGKVQTSTTGILFFQDIEVEADNTDTKIDRTLRFGLGPIYSSGSQVTENGTRKLNVNSGTYYYGTHQYNPTGGTAIEWTAWYRAADATGTWTTFAQNTIDNVNYNQFAVTWQGLQPLGGTNHAKHLLYVVNDDILGHESYHLVYGQTSFANIGAAQVGDLPNPPSDWTSNIVKVYSIIVANGTANIVEFRDERPRLGFVASTTAGVTVHNDLTGRDSATAHTQYLLKDGTDAMTGDLDMNTNDITDIGTLNGVTIENHSDRHQPNSASDPLSCAAPSANLTTTSTNAEGNTDFFSRSNHSHAITTASANTASTIVARDGSGDFSAHSITMTGVDSFNEADWTGGNVTYVPLTGSIQAYVTAAAAGDTLILASGQYTITSAITVNKELNIMGQGNAGFFTAPLTAGHGTLINSTTGGVTGFNITSSNVRIAHLSLNLTGAASTGIGTANNLTGIVLTNVDVVVTCSGLAQGFMIYGSNAVLRNLTFYITSTNGSCSGLYFYNTATTTQNAIVDCFSVTGTTKGTNVAGDNWSFLAENQNDANTITLNLSNSVCQALAGTGTDIAVASVSFGSGTNSSIVNAYQCTLDGHDWDAFQDGTNQLNLGGSVLVNNKVSGTVTYRATMAAGSGVFGGTLTVASGTITDATGIKLNNVAYPVSAVGNRIIYSSAANVIGEAAAITANRALISDANGIPVHSAITNTQLAKLSSMIVSPSVVGNFPSFSDVTGGLQDSTYKNADYVHMTGNETIAGVKTFSNSISVTQNCYYLINSLVLANGANNNVVIGNGTFFRITGPTANFNVSGITADTNGRRIILFYPLTAGDRMTINNDSGSSTAANRIYTCTGGDLQTGAGAGARGVFEFIYSSTDSRWILISYIL